METRPPAVGSEASSKSDAPSRRRRRNGDESRARFFLPKTGSTLKSLELGQEFGTEGAALVEALKRDQCFYAVTIWKAVPQQNGGDPVITKQAVTDSKGE